MPSMKSHTHRAKASAQRNDETPAATLGDRRCTQDPISRRPTAERLTTARPAPQGPRTSTEFAEPVAVSFTDSADIRLPPSAFEVGFDLLPLRARRSCESTRPLPPRQEVVQTKTVQIADKCSPHFPHSAAWSVESFERALERARPGVQSDDQEDDRGHDEPVDDEHRVRVAPHVVEQDPDRRQRGHGRGQHPDDERASRSGR